MYAIRKATLRDCALIHALAWRVFPQTYRGILSPEQIEYMMEWMYSEPNVRHQMEEEGHVYFMAAGEDGQEVGYVSVRPDVDGVYHLEKIYVLPEAQKHHVGGLLFRRVVDYVKEADPQARAIELNVNRQNPALGFYRHIGMHIDRQGDFDIGGGFYMNDYIMRLDL